MFTSFEMSDDSGVLLGVNRHNNSLCFVDLFNTKINKNANLTMCGTSGAARPSRCSFWLCVCECAVFNA